MADNPSSRSVSSRGQAGERLVGRERETAELRRAVDLAFGGHGSVVLVAGEPGIGKTSVARTVCEEAEARGAVTAWGVGWSGGAAPAYWPWVQVVRGLLRSAGGSRLLADLGPQAVWLAEIVPDLRSELPTLPEAVSSTADEGRFRVYDALSELLRRCAAEAPLVVVLDDLHWADEASLHTLAFVARSLQDAGVLLLGTYRDTELTGEERGASVLAELLGWSSRIPLRGLETDGVRRLIENLSAEEVPDPLVQHLHAVTGGNPLFVGELVTLLEAEGRLTSDLRVSELPLPEGVREAISQRFTPLPPKATEALSVASVIGNRFSVDTLSLAADIPRDELLGLLDVSVQIGLLHPVADAVGQYAFSHPLVQATLYEGLPSSRRIALHHAVGEALEAVAGDRPEARLTELAHHFLEAAPASGPERGVAYAWRAGDRAMAQFAYDEAANLFARALAALASPGDPATLPFLQALGEAQTRAGDTAAARRTLVEAADVARRHDDARGLARATVSCGIWGLSFGVDDELVRLAEEAVERLQGEHVDGLLPRVQGLLAAALYWSPERERAQRLSDDAVALAREQHAAADDRASGETLAYVLGRALLVGWGPHSAERQLNDSLELLELSHALDDSEIELMVRNWRISVLLESGDVAAVDQEIARVRHMANTLRQPRAMAFLPLHNGMRAVMDGRFDDAESAIADSAEIGRRVRGSVSELAATAQLVIIRLLQGRLPEIEAPLSAMSNAHPEMVALRCALSVLLVQADRLAEAGRELERLTEGGLDGLPPDNTHIVMLALLGETAAELGDGARAQMLYDWLEPYSGRWVVSPGAAVMWPVDRSLGRLAGVLGHTEDAFAHLSAAGSQAERAGSLPSLALCAVDEARLVATAAAPSEASDRVARLADRAHALGSRLGMRGVESEAARFREAQAPSVSAPARSEAKRSAGALQREGDVWTLTLDDRVVRLKDAKGLRHLALLLASPGVGFHALEIVAAGEGNAASADRAASAAASALSVRSGGQSGLGALLDPQAKAAYRERLADLQETIDEAETMNDPERAALAREELDGIAQELAGAIGLGGRDRPAGSDAERARVNATRAIRATLRRLEEHDPRLGRLLARSIRTGTVCIYEPDPDHPIVWTVEA
jgi:tetratricopeptide (TPR) repeat protein